MRKFHSPFYAILILLLAAFGLAGCAAPSYLNIDYRLPGATQLSPGSPVFLRVVDERSSQEVFGPAAQDSFRNFTGIYALYLGVDSDQKILTGSYTLAALFQTAMTRRLERQGFRVVNAPDPGTPILEIAINQFLLDRVGNEWHMNIGYEARVLRGKKINARESVSAEGQRVRLFGFREAEEILGEVFSDSINRLNIAKLFKNAGL
jgi:uncharacterized lipoprotein YajG